MDDLDKKMWEAHCKQVGGVTFDGKPIPTWEELGADRRACWRRACLVANRKAFEEFIDEYID